MANCRWPLGDPGTPSFGYCGCDRLHVRRDGKVSVYCADHHAVAYVPVPKRADRGENPKFRLQGW